MAHQMARGSQVAFAKAWLERHNIESQTVDVYSHIDSSLSYEENIKNLKQMLGMGGRSTKKATRDLSAAECDVAIGNYNAGFDHESTREACDCGEPTACDCGEPTACDDVMREKKTAVKTKAPPIYPPTTPKKKEYKPTKAWEDFVKINKTQISKHTAGIKKWSAGIKDKKQGEKLFKDEIRQYKIDITDIWSKTKGKVATEPTTKPKKKTKATATPKFTTTKDAEQWLETKYKEYGGRWKFQATPEYKEVYPHLLDLYGKKNRQIEKERKQVNIVKNPYGPEYSIEFEKTHNTYVGGGRMGGMATFETVAKAVKEARQLGYEIMSKPKATPSVAKKAPAPPTSLAATTPNPLVMLGAGTVQAVTKPKRRPAAKKPARKKRTAAKTTKAKPKATPKRRAVKPKKTVAKPKPKVEKTAGTAYKLTAAQKKMLATNGRITVKRGGKFITITK